MQPELLYNVANASGTQWTGYRLHDGKLVDAYHPSHMELTQMYRNGTRVYAIDKRTDDVRIRDAVLFKLTGWL